MKKIVVVDDDPGILEVTKFILEDSEYDVKTSENSSIFKKLTKGNMPDVILLDVLLSGEDGREIAMKLKSNKRTRNIPIIMISAHPSARENAMELGADDFIAKPFDVDHLLTVVAKYAN